MTNGDNAVRAAHLETLAINLKLFTLAELSILANALINDVSALSIPAFYQDDFDYIFNDNAFTADDLNYIFTNGADKSDIDWVYVFTDGETSKPFSQEDLNHIFN